MPANCLASPRTLGTRDLMDFLFGAAPPAPDMARSSVAYGGKSYTRAFCLRNETMRRR